MPKTAIHWFRRDFRIRDNTALLAAAKEADTVVGLFVIDPRWMHASAKKTGGFQIRFWLDSLRELQHSLAERNIPLVIRTNPDPVHALLQLAQETSADLLTLNKEYEPDQLVMDERLELDANRANIPVRTFKDAAIFEEEELLTGAGTPYSVFTPYRNAYLKKLADHPPTPAPIVPRMKAAPKIRSEDIPSLESLGYKPNPLDLPPGERAAAKLLQHFCAGPILSYRKTRDLPALSITLQGTSRLSAHLNAGTLSLRQAMSAAIAAHKTGLAHESIATFVGELIWRDFYRMILFHFPRTVSFPFQRNYSHITWKNDPALFTAWKEARTGYPLVDAAMQQLLQTGFMHNRLRMISAMFLTKDLDTHWVLGERFFMQSLIDYDQACNVGGWQWAASTGTDAAPYFRVMNPILQSEKFDPDGQFIKHFLPALKNVPTQFIHAPWEMPQDLQQKSNCIIGRDYPSPIVDHAEAKEHAIAKFRKRSAAHRP